MSPHLTLAVASQLLILSTAVQEGRNSHMATQPEPVSPSWRITFPNTFALGRERQLLTGSCCPWLYLCLRGSYGEKLPRPPLFHMLFIGLQFNKPFKSSLKLSVSSKGMLVSSTVCMWSNCNAGCSQPAAIHVLTPAHWHWVSPSLAFLSSELFVLFRATDSWRGIVLSTYGIKWTQCVEGKDHWAGGQET